MKIPPMQPLYLDENGTIRFRENKLVTYLLDKGPFDMNKLAFVECSQGDREQFAQLIGYSLSGFAELSYVSDATYETAQAMWEEEHGEKDAYIAILEGKLELTRKLLKELVPALFKIHEDDLEW